MKQVLKFDMKIPGKEKPSPQPLKEEPKMLITRVSYERVKNLGNYESERISMEGIPAEGECVDACLASLKIKVGQSLGLIAKDQKTPAAVGTKPESAPAQEETTETKTTKTTKKTQSKKEASKKTTKATPAKEEADTETKADKPNADDVRAALQKFAKENGREAGFEILSEFDAKKVVDLKEEQYAEVIERLENAAF